MLRAVVQRLEKQYCLGVSTDLHVDGQAGIPAMKTLKSQPTLREASAALKSLSPVKCLSLAKRSMVLPLLSQRFLETRGIGNTRDLVALLDCSGFAYGDQWSSRRLVARVRYYEMLRGRGVKLIMLPQALGSFENPEIRSHAQHLLAQFDCIYARDAVSERHVLGLGLDPEKVSVCPDLTHLLAAPKPVETEPWARRVAIVPNARLLDKTEATVARTYLEFLVLCVERVRANDLEPVILQHETNDGALIQQLLERLDVKPQVFNEDGLTSKGFLGCCYANLGSRYHSVVSSLSQATPTLGTSWTHKYEALFAEYHCEDCLVSPALDAAILRQKIDAFLIPQRNAQLRELLLARAADQGARVEAMWQRVEAMISEPGTEVTSHHRAVTKA